MPKLRDYQIEDINFLSKLSSAGVFNEQRTGKTPTTLKLLEKLGCTKILIVCPSSALYQWQEEFIRWLDKPCVVINGTPKAREQSLNNWTNGLIISYDQLKTTSNHIGYADKILKFKPDAVIIDEAHRIKNPKSATAKAVFKLSAVKYKYALTGTPAPNKPWEVFSILKFLYPMVFRSYWKFLESYFQIKDVYLYGKGSHKEIVGYKNEKTKQHLLYILSSISVQRKRAEILSWIPEKDYSQVVLPPTPQQTKALKELEQFYETGDVVAVGVLDRLIRYRQICLDPKLLDIKSKSPKTEWLKNYFNDYPDRPTIVFSKFTSYIHILEKELIKYKFGVIVGNTPIQKRHEYIKRFQAGDLNILLINIDAGKEALTLDRAEAIIFTDKYPPAGDILQAEDRFIATTKAKADKPHLIYELMIKGTYDQELYKLVKERISETDLINNYKKYLKGGKSK